MDLLKRFLTAKVEVQAALIGTLNFAQLFGLLELSEQQLTGSNMLLVVWMALVSKVAFGRQIEELTE